MKVTKINPTDYVATDKFTIDNIYNRINNSNPKRAMAQDMEMFILMQQAEPVFAPEKLKDLKSKILLIDIIESRLSMYDYTLDYPTLFFIAYLAESPGNAILFLSYLQVCAKQLNLDKINMFDIGIKIFPSGFPTDECLQNIWKSCKVYKNSNDKILNFVDVATPYQSSKRQFMGRGEKENVSTNNYEANGNK